MEQEKPGGPAPRAAGGARVDMTQGPILRRLVALAWPLFTGNILTTFYNLADMFWVAQVGTAAVAAVSITFPTVWLTFSIGLGVTIAGVAFVSQHTGAGDLKQAARVAGQVILLACGAGVVLGMAAILARRPIVSAMGARGEVLDLAAEYLLITFSGLPFRYIYFAYRSVSQGTGDGKTPRNLLLFTTLFNAAFDPFLIFGWWGLPELGVAGAAWATWIAELLGAVVSLAFLFGGRLAGVRVRLADLRPDFALMKRILRIGAAGSVDMGSRGLASVVSAGIVSRFGTVEAAAYGIVLRIMSVVWTSSGAVEQAVASGVGQNLGAANPARAERLAWTGAALIFAFLTAVAAVIHGFAEEAMGLFRVAGDVVATGARFLRLHVLTYGFSGAFDVLLGAFRGAGKTSPAALLSFVHRWALQIPLALLLSFAFSLGADGYWIAFSAANLLMAAAAALWFQRGTWKVSLVAGAPRPSKV